MSEMKKRLKPMAQDVFDIVGSIHRVRGQELIRAVDIRIVAISVQALADRLWSMAEELDE